jgi:hypothetical protein
MKPSHVIRCEQADGKEIFLMTRMIPDHNCRRAVRYTVENADTGRVVGLLEKYVDTDTEINPWKAFIGIGHDCKFVEAFYGVRGRATALAAIAKLIL